MNLPTFPSWAGAALKLAPYVLIAVLSGLLMLCNKAHDATTAKLKAEQSRSDTYQTAYTGWRDGYIELSAKVVEQNRSIEALKEQAKVERSNYEARLQLARRDAAVDEAKAKDLLALIAPDGELNQCRAARDLLESELVP